MSELVLVEVLVEVSVAVLVLVDVSVEVSELVSDELVESIGLSHDASKRAPSVMINNNLLRGLIFRMVKIITKEPKKGKFIC